MSTPEQIAAGLDPSKLQAKLRRLMTRIVIKVETESKRVTPVRTGNLRRSITHAVEDSGRRGIVGTNVRYAPHVHGGARGRPGRPFLTKGLAASRDSIEQWLVEAGNEFFAEVR